MIAEILHKLMSMKHREVEQQAFRYRPSLAGPERCVRQLTYLRIGTKPEHELPGRTLMIFETGQWNEEVLASLIDQTAFRLHSRQMKVQCWHDKDLDLHGSIDGVLTDPLGIDRLWECKGINHFSWQRYALGEALPEDYLTQSALYLRGLRELTPILRECILTLRNKNTDQIVDLLLDYDYVTDRLTVLSKTLHTGQVTMVNARRERICQSAVEKFTLVELHAQSGTLPEWPAGFSAGDFPCSYCPHETQCWNGFIAQTTAAQEVTLPVESNAEIFASQYLTFVERAKSAEIEKTTHRDKLLSIMRGHQATRGIAGSFIITRSVQERQGRINEEVLDLRTKAALIASRGTPTVTEVLKVTRKKPFEGGE